VSGVRYGLGFYIPEDDSMRRLLVTASVVPNSPILVTLMETLSSSETSVLTRATRRNIPEDAFFSSIIANKKPVSKRSVFTITYIPAINVGT
jgi:hypothetical protein